jgi:hypothetical protein
MNYKSIVCAAAICLMATTALADSTDDDLNAIARRTQQQKADLLAIGMAMTYERKCGRLSEDARRQYQAAAKTFTEFEIDFTAASIAVQADKNPQYCDVVRRELNR